MSAVAITKDGLYVCFADKFGVVWVVDVNGTDGQALVNKKAAPMLSHYCSIITSLVRLLLPLICQSFITYSYDLLVAFVGFSWLVRKVACWYSFFCGQGLPAAEVIICQSQKICCYLLDIPFDIRKETLTFLLLFVTVLFVLFTVLVKIFS